MSQELDEYRLLVADVYELAGVSRRTSEQVARSQGLTAARWHIMSVVREEALSVSAVARRLGLARQSVQRVVDDLAASGHVRLDPDPTDRRAPRVTLTAAGQECVARLFAASEAGRDAVLARAGVTAAALAEARRTVRALVRALSEPAARDE